MLAWLHQTLAPCPSPRGRGEQSAKAQLYGKSQRLQSLYPQCSVRLARFRGTDRLGDFIDNRQYWGHAFALLRRAETFLLDHVPIAGRVVSGRMKRQDRPLYPPRATREAVANALCHRDYTIPGGAVSMAMYDDRLEIINTGTLHFDITPEMLTQPHQSKPWNPIIAGVFCRVGIIEQWGTGTLKVIDWCRDNANPVPIWEEQSGSVVVTFRPAATVDPRKQQRVARAALSFLKHYGTLDQPSRMDVIGVTWPPGRWRPRIEHIPNAFEPPG